MDERGKIRLGEAHIWRRDTIMLNIRGDVFVVWVGTSKRWIIWMRLRIIPSDFICLVP